MTVSWVGALTTTNKVGSSQRVFVFAATLNV